MKKRIRIFANLPLWKPCLKAFWGNESDSVRVRLAILAINQAAGSTVLTYTAKDK